MPTRHREEVLNTYFAALISGYGLSASPEEILESGKHRPDVLILYRGMRVMLEGKYADSAQAEGKVSEQAQERVDLGLSQIAIAVLYPAVLRTTEVKQLKNALYDAEYRFCVFSELGQGQWRSGTVAALIVELQRTWSDLTQQDLVEQAAKQLSQYLDGVARLLQEEPAVCEELAEILGVGRPGQEKRLLREKRLQTTAKVAALTVANAFIFQEQLAVSGVKKIVPLRDSLRQPDLVSRTIEHWDWICDTINYVPIFRIAANILSKLPAGALADDAVKALAGQALAVCANRAALRHDLMGRIYHYLLHEAKFLGTYYTSVPAATLLLKLALAPENWRATDFSDPEALRGFRIADLTCGTGTLLMASCQAMLDNFVLASADKGRKLDAKRLGKLHGALMDAVIHGYDVLPSAIHLTASTLALLAPEVVFDRLRLYTVPLNMQGKRAWLGSLEFMDSAEAKTQFSLFGAPDAEAQAVTGKGMKSGKVSVPAMDLFVMNPPFVRSVGGNLLFGNMGDAQREKMQAALKDRLDKSGLQANITAGLGSVFVAIADKYLKPGGRLAFVLPAALATGIAWQPTRRLLQQKYHLEYVVMSHQPDRWAFSENTDLSELLFVARKLHETERNTGLKTVFINLWRNPSNAGDALAVVRVTEKAEKTRAEFCSPGGLNLTELGYKYGEALIVPMQALDDTWWGGTFAQTELVCAGHLLTQGKLVVPGKKAIPFPIVKLSEIASLGPDRRDIHDGFEVVDYPTAYPALWNHESDKIQAMALHPDKWLSPRTIPAPGRRKIHEINTLWEKSSDFVIAERLRLNTHRVAAGIVEKSILGSTWWETRLHIADSLKLKGLALFFNSTVGLLALLFNRISTEGAWIQLKKPTLLNLPIPDFAKLPEGRLEKLAEAFDRLSGENLLPLSQIAADPVRAQIDNALSAALDLPDLAPLREMLGREPVMTNRSLLDSKRPGA